MIMLSIRRLLVMLCLLGSVKIHAQVDTTLPPNLPKEWTLQDCIEYAKKKNISIATLRLTVQSAQEDYLQSKAAVLPNLTANASQGLVNSNNANPVVGGFQTQASLSGNYGVNSSIVLFNGGYLKNDIKSKDLSVRSANLSVKETENDLTLSITQAFFNILLSQETIDALQSVLTTSQEQLKQGQQKFDAGAIAKKDFLQFQSQVASDQYNLINAENVLRLNTVTLKQILLLPTNYDFKVKTPDTVPVIQAQAKLEEAQNEAQQTRPEVLNAQVQIERAQVEIQKSEAARKPTLSLGAGLATGYSDNQTFGYFSQLTNNFYQSLGLNLGIPIYTRRVNKTNINKSKILYEQARLSLLNTKTVLNQQVEQAYINLVNAQAQYQAADTQLRSTKEIYDITNEQLKLGAITTFELLQQKTLYVQALQSYTQAKYTAALYNKIYEFYMGIPVTF